MPATARGRYSLVTLGLRSYLARHLPSTGKEVAPPETSRAITECRASDARPKGEHRPPYRRITEGGREDGVRWPLNARADMRLSFAGIEHLPKPNRSRTIEAKSEITQLA